VTLPVDYTERVYAGVLGKIIGVYLGRPYEGWRHDRIAAELGDITYYVNDRTDVALKHHLFLVTDDDIIGTLVFPRALRDAGLDPTPAQVGETWLNEIVEDTTVLWWGGLGNSTEHTAYLRMKSGVVPPRSGSAELNGKVVSEQVGAQIFVEGFAMTCPGDVRRAADLAESAASVSHDGEALLAARVVAALVAGAFTATSMDDLLDLAVAQIPADSLIAQIHRDVRSWARAGDWKATRARIEEHYGYHLYGGNCHVVPNHAVVVAALAHSAGDFDSAMTVVCTSGWDTDSNAGNVGAVCGVFGGLAGLATQDWRGPVRDRIYLPTGEGGGCITDAAREALTLAAYGHRRNGATLEVPSERFHFRLPGSVQGFGVAEGEAEVANTGGRLRIVGDAVVVTPTFIPPEAREMPIYGLVASPTIFPGQTIRAVGTGAARLVLQVYDGDDALRLVEGPALEPDGTAWTVPALDQPIVAVGLRVAGHAELDSLTWDGEPDVVLTRPAEGGTMWRRAWVPAVDRFDARWPEPYRITQNRGLGQLVTGTLEWRDYSVRADVTPHLARAAGLAARVQGLRRAYRLELRGRDTVRLLRGTDVLAEAPFAWEYGETHELRLDLLGEQITGYVDGRRMVQAFDATYPSGGVALTVEEGSAATQQVQITPMSTTTGEAGHITKESA
jgi:ADP-ribosylglycohydrolase